MFIVTSRRTRTDFVLIFALFSCLIIDSTVSIEEEFCHSDNQFDCQKGQNIEMSNHGEEDYKNAKNIYGFTARDIKGNVIPLEKYKGHVCIIVNVASQCGYTKVHYAELSELYKEYGESKGLRILAFPCNQFAGQEPGNSDKICEFARSRNVEFDMFEKINVNGADTHPLWKYLKHVQGGTLGDFIKWNFTKFIIDKNGVPVERHGPSTNPKDMLKSLEKYW